MIKYRFEDESVGQSAREQVDAVFDGRSERALAIRGTIQYSPPTERRSLQHGSLLFEVVLNSPRKAEIGRQELDKRSAEVAEIPESGKATLAEHKEPCAYAAISDQKIFGLECDGIDFDVIVNIKPWSRGHIMMTKAEHVGQVLHASELRTALLFLQSLGSDYEGVFSGVLAGASVFHYHFHYHRGSAAVWQNLDAGRVISQPVWAKHGARLLRVAGWPAEAFLFVGADPSELAEVVGVMLDAFVEGENDIPFNLGCRYEFGLFRVLVFPRATDHNHSLALERPQTLNDFPGSWGRFAFEEMGGSVFLLVPDAFKATEPRNVNDAIGQMSASLDSVNLLTDIFAARVGAKLGASVK